MLSCLSDFNYIFININFIWQRRKLLNPFHFYTFMLIFRKCQIIKLEETDENIIQHSVEETKSVPPNYKKWYHII